MIKPTHKLRAMSREAAAVIAAAPSLVVAAKRLGVDRSTVHRWLKAGKVTAPAGWIRSARARTSLQPVHRAQSPKSWADSIRKKYELEPTEETLVDLAVRALTVARDPKMKPETQLAAMGRYQQIVRQLNLEHGETNGEVATDTGAVTRSWPRRAG